jgi:iron(III) transport system permease protein
LPILAVLGAWLTPAGEALGHIAATTLPILMANTLGLLVGVGVGVSLVGVGTAWLVTACRFPGRDAFEWLLLLPLAMPTYIIGYAYADLLSFAGPAQTMLRTSFGWSRGDYWFPDVQSLGGVAFVFTFVLYPYVYLLARTAFLDHSGAAMEAARTLGRTPFAAFLSAALPLARPAVAAGVALALMEALADFATVEYYGVQTFTTAVYRTWFGMGDRVAAMQLASGLLVFAFALVLAERTARRSSRFHGPGRKHHAMRPFTLRGGRALAASLACAIPVALGFALPVAILVGLHLEGGDALTQPRFLSFAWHSFALAAAAAALVVAAALLLAYAVRLAAAPLTDAAVRFSTLGYALPGTVVAVGVLYPLGAFDAAVDAAARSWLGLSTGLLLSGTIVALLFAYLVRFLAVAHGALESGFARIPNHVDEVARTLGSGPAAVCARIHVPLLRRSVLAAAIIVFVEVLKELPATLIVRPFNFDTLAVRVYQLAADERLAQASTGALVIVALGLLPVIVLTRMLAQDRRRAAGASAVPVLTEPARGAL